MVITATKKQTNKQTKKKAKSQNHNHYRRLTTVTLMYPGGHPDDAREHAGTAQADYQCGQ